MSDIKIFTAEEKAKLKQLMNEGLSVLSEIETLSGGLADTVKAIAEDMDIKPGVLKKAIRTAYKSTFHQTTSDYELLESILESVGRTE
jgi:tryptophan 2,3-dioxygenase